MPNAHFLSLEAAAMGDMAQRLRDARAKAGYTNAKEAAEAMGVKYATYAQHENGHRGFPADVAARYARFFKTTPEWLIYGRGPQEATSTDPTQPELERMIADALSEVTLETRLSDLPRIVASNLHEQLARFRADREALRCRDQGKGPRKTPQLPPPTKPS